MKANSSALRFEEEDLSSSHNKLLRDSMEDQEKILFDENRVDESSHFKTKQDETNLDTMMSKSRHFLNSPDKEDKINYENPLEELKIENSEDRQFSKNAGFHQ